MPLPADPKAPWPPKPWQPFARDMTEASAWYSGDEARLIAFYGEPAHTVGHHTPAGRNVSGWSRFWARRSTDSNTPRQRIHAPAAADVAATSADLLFGEEPRILIPDADQATTDRLDQIADADDWPSLLLEGAEIAAAIGVVYLRPVVDMALADHPLLVVEHGDHAVPEHRHGKLTAVTFWRQLESNDDMVLRWLERYEPGRILHGLYAGTRDALGVRRLLASHPVTAQLVEADEGADPMVGEDGIVTLPGLLADRLLVEEIPNALPNRKHRGRPIGRADTAGTESLMDALDETMTSWMRDVRLAKHRIIAPREFLESKGRGEGQWFDADAEVFSPIEMDPTTREKASIQMTSFAIRFEEHARTAAELFGRIVVTAGYAPATFGLAGETGAEQTATEVVARQGRTASTTRRKQRYWRRFERAAETVLMLDREFFGTQVDPARPRLEFGERDEDPHRVAETVDLLRRARAASTETLVRMSQPHLEPEEVTAEVGRIMAEEALAAPDVLPAAELPAELAGGQSE